MGSPESKVPLIVNIVNRQIVVGDSKYVVVSDPILSDHVIRRMRIDTGSQLVNEERFLRIS